MKPNVLLPGEHLEAVRGVHVRGEYRYLPQALEPRRAESCTVLQLAREGRRGRVMALVEFADGHQQVVGGEWLRSLRERHLPPPVDWAQ